VLTPNGSVDVFVRVALAHAQADTDGLVELLLSEGVDSETAECLVAFVPMAFAHVILGDAGVRLPDDFIVQDPNSGRSTNGKLRDEPIFRAAYDRARAMLSADPEDPRVREIASGSAEWSAIAHLTRDGRGPSACGLTETVLMRLPPDYLHRPAPPTQRWWKFWNRFG